MSDDLVEQAEDGMVGTTDDAGYRWYFDSTVTVGSKPMFTIDTPVKWIWESGGSVGPYPETHPATKAVLTSEWRNNERVYQISLNTKYYSSGDPDAVAKKATCRALFDANRQAPVGPDMSWSDPNFGNLRADSAICGTLCMVVDGYEIVVPDVWWLLGHNYFDGEWLYSWMFSNWCDYAPLRSELDAEQHVSMYGYRVKDNAPMVVDFTMHKRNGSAQANTSVKARPLYTDNVSTFLDEFNWKLAVKRLETNWGLDTSSFVKTDGMNDFKRVYLPFTAGSMDVQTVQVSDLGQQVQVHKDYAQQFTLRNQTDAPMVMKSSDYTIAIATTDTWTVSLSVKEAFSWSTKVTEKVTLKLKFPMPLAEDTGERTTEESTEKTFTKAAEFTQTGGYTHTRTTTETFAFSGQTFTVPPKTDLQLNYDVYRGEMTGKIRVLMDLPDDPHFKAIELQQGGPGQGWLVTKRTVSLDLAKAKEVLGLTRIYDSWVREDKSIARGTLVAAIVNMTVDIGVIGHISVEPVKREKQLSAVTEEELRPVASLQSMSIEMPLAVPLKGLVAPPPPTDLAIKAVGDSGHSVDVTFRPGPGSDGLVKNWLLTIADHSFVVPLSAPGADGLVKARVRTLGSGLKTFTEYDAFVAGVTASGTTAPSNTAKANIR